MNYTPLSSTEVAHWTRLYNGGLVGLQDPALSDKPRELLTRIIWFAAIANSEGELLELAAQEGPALHRWMAHPEFARYLVRAYEHFVAQGSLAACCNLGSLYYSGEGVGQDYEKARELYELGSARGDDQATVNLGYIYYYGRCACGVDYTRAYECFARSALLNGNPEALWKLGDLYAGGSGVPQSDQVAWQLYVDAYRRSGEPLHTGRAAHHVADYLMTGIEGAVERNPEAALKLYIEAEIGYRHAIREGQEHYRGCLEQALEGQARARAALVELLGNE